MRRVISEVDVIPAQHQSNPSGAHHRRGSNNAPSAAIDEAEQPFNCRSENTPLNVVEPEGLQSMDVDEKTGLNYNSSNIRSTSPLITGAPLQMIRRNLSDAVSHSSLSGDEEEAAAVAEDQRVNFDNTFNEVESANENVDMEEASMQEEQHQAPNESVPSGMKRTASDFQRMDSVNGDSSSGSLGRASSQNSSRDWGWFKDVHQSSEHLFAHDKKQTPTVSRTGLVSEVSGEPVSTMIKHMDKDSSMAVTAPTYVLEESLSNQKLWKYTAGNRPPQPVDERAFYERMWAQNFAKSQVQYSLPVDVLTAASPICMSPFAEGNFEGSTADGSDLANYNLASISVQQDPQTDAAEAALVFRLTDGADNDTRQQVVVNKTVKGSTSDGDLKVLIRGDNVFGTTVSKSFPRYAEPSGPIAGVDTVNISVASYRVVESKKYGKYAQFLVIYREGSIRDTIGLWKRYRDFERLAQIVTHSHEGCASAIANMSPLAVTEEPETEHLPNAITSWRLLKKRQRWYRCLDAGYLSLKVFLLERFLHDILFESSAPQLLREFVFSGDDS
jgi:hypothetical protein